MRQVAKYYLLSPKTQPFSPLDLSPALWLDASDATTITASSGAVSEWRDRSGNARHVSQGTAANQPTTGASTLNGLNLVTCATPRFARNTATHNIGTTSTTFAVVRPIGVATKDYVTGSVNNSNAHILYTTTANAISLYSGVVLSSSTNVSVGVATMLVAQTNGASSVLRKDGVQIVTGDAGTQNWSVGFHIGANAVLTTFTDAHYAEVVVYPSVLSASDIIKVETYLRDKWGTP